MLIATIGALAAATGIALAWPQVAHIVVRRQTVGVSALTWMLSMCSSIAWLGVGIVEHIVPTLFFNSMTGVGSAMVLVALARQRQVPRWQPPLAAIGMVAVVLAAYLAFGAAGPSALGIGLSIAMYVPQVVAVFARPTSGVSPTTWWLSLASCALWTLYGVLIGEWVLVAPVFVMAPASALILWRIRSRVLLDPSATLPVGDENVSRAE